MLLHEFLEQTIRKRPEAVALICGERRWRYAEIGALVERLAAAMQRRGVHRGERVAIYAENGVETVVGIYAALRCGAVFMPINPLTKKDKLAYLVDDARPVCMLASASLLQVVQEALPANGPLRTCIVSGGPAPAVGAGGPAPAAAVPGIEFVRFEPALAEGGTMLPVPTIDQDLASILYTSGSTGEPKGVMLTHLNMVTAMHSVRSYLELQDEDMILCALPLSFGYGLYQILMGFACGACVVLERSFAFPVQVLERMQRLHVTVFPGVPSMFAALLGLETLPQYDLASLRLITNAAAALPERQIQELRRLLPQARLFSMYGLTECKRVSYLPPEELERRPQSVGRGMPNQEVWLVDEEGRRLPPGSTGELVIRGSHVMRGYWRKPAETAERLKPGPLPGEKVLHSGDIFRMDEEGYLYFVARKDDIIKSQGEKVSPREVENVLCSIDGVQEAAVVGVPDALLGEAVKAILVLKPGHAYTEREIVKHCLAKMESFMAPKYVEFVRDLPRTNTGKIEKKALR